MFYIEECRYNEKGAPKHKQKVFHGNITAMCLNLEMNSVAKTNESKDVDYKFMSKCSKLLSKEEFVKLEGYGDCTWNGKSVRKWIKFVHNTLTTIGYHEFKVRTEMGRYFLVFYCWFGVPLTILCYIHFGRIVRICIRRAIRRIEAHFFNREEPLNIRHKVLLYNSGLIIIVLLISAGILQSGLTNLTFIECLYFCTGVVSTSGNDGSHIDTTFYETHTSLSILLEIFQIIGLGLVSSLIQAGSSYQRAKHRRQRLDLQAHQKLLNSQSKQTANGPKQNLLNGAIEMDSLVILVKNGDTHDSRT